MYQPPEIEQNFHTGSLPSGRLRASFTDLVDGDGESGFDVGIHVFLPVVAEKTRSLEDGVHFRPTLGVGGQLLRRGTEEKAVVFAATEKKKKDGSRREPHKTTA